MKRDELDGLIDGLLYMSESDEPLTYYKLDKKGSQQWPPATAAEFLMLIGKKTPVQEIEPEKFFQTLMQGNEDRREQVEGLRRAVLGELEEVRCYRAGEIEIEIYLLGKETSGKVCGLRTLSIET